MLTERWAAGWIVAVGLLASFLFVPWLRHHRTVIYSAYLAVLAAVGLIRGRKGSRVLALSFLVPFFAIALSVLGLWVNVWLGLACIVAFIVILPTTALVVAYRRGQRATMS